MVAQVEKMMRAAAIMMMELVDEVRLMPCPVEGPNLRKTHDGDVDDGAGTKRHCLAHSAIEEVLGNWLDGVVQLVALSGVGMTEWSVQMMKMGWKRTTMQQTEQLQM